MPAREIVEFNSLFSVRKKKHFASKERGGARKENKTPAQGLHMLVHVLCILQILLAGNGFISPLAASAAAVLTDAGLAPADQAELCKGVASGTQAPGR